MASWWVSFAPVFDRRVLEPCGFERELFVEFERSDPTERLAFFHWVKIHCLRRAVQDIEDADRRRPSQLSGVEILDVSELPHPLRTPRSQRVQIDLRTPRKSILIA